MGLAQNSTGGVTQVLVHVSTLYFYVDRTQKDLLILALLIHEEIREMHSRRTSQRALLRSFENLRIGSPPLSVVPSWFSFWSYSTICQYVSIAAYMLLLL